MFNNPAVILEDLTDALAQAGVSALEPKWTAIAQRSQQWAYFQVVAKLVARGYLPAQVAAWDLGPVAERELAVVRALRAGGMLQAVSDEMLKSFDGWLEELKTVVVTAGGAFVVPQGTIGVPNTGEFDSSGDLFGTPIDPDNPLLGETVRF